MTPQEAEDLTTALARALETGLCVQQRDAIRFATGFVRIYAERQSAEQENDGDG